MQGNKSVFFAGCLTGFLTPLILFAIVIGLMIGPFKDQLVASMADKLQAPAISTGEQADYNWSISTADGETVDPQSWAGKPVFVSFWDPGCTPCLSELPAMEALYQQARAMDMVFAAVALDNQDDAFAHMEEQAYAFPVYALEGELPPPFKTEKKPATFIVGRDGTIVFKHVGAAKWDDPSVLTLLQNLSITEVPATE